LPSESHQNHGRYLSAEYANGDRLNPVEFTAMRYEDFLEQKKVRVEPSGFELHDDQLPTFLFDYQKYIVRMSLAKGKFAIFAGTGLGKTAMQLSWAIAVFNQTNRPVLILAPLAVAKQTAFDESKKFGIDVQYCETQEDVINGINITNYEKLGHFTTDSFVGIVLDESSILKSFTGAIRTQLIECFADTPYRLACSATPSPNDHMELGNHAEFLGIMTRVEMLAQYFIHDGGDTSKWRLKKHGKEPFWQWLASWSVMLQKPSDLGFSDDNYRLPPLNQYQIYIEAGIKRDGELFSLQATGLLEQRQIKKQTLPHRVKAIADLVNQSSEQWIVWCETNDESAELTKAIVDAVEVKGADSEKHKEQAAIDFAHGSIRVLVSKAAIYGFGMNWQNCHNVAFVGMSNSFELTYQSIRRCYRFGQTQPVNVYFAVTDSCGAIVQNMERKAQQFDEMLSQLIRHMGQGDRRQTLRQRNTYMENRHTGKGFELYLGDCVETISTFTNDSIDYSIFSPPFSSLYTYSNSERDMGNTTDDAEFMRHFTFLAEQLYRVIKPGCLLSFHVQNLPAQIQRDGYYGRKDLRGDLIRCFEQFGFVYYSEVTIWKDPVIQMQRTKALGLLHKQVKKDSSKCHQGHADYLVTMRKPGDRAVPVAGMFDDFYGTDIIPNTDEIHTSIEIWQRYASPIWLDIDPSDTLQYRQARHNDDERHICPLQLTVIRRALQLWTSPGDLVLSPFAGIGSEGYVSLDMDRRFVGVELKESYWECAVKNLDFVANKPQQLSLIA
jgi:DNA modification methylase